MKLKQINKGRKCPNCKKFGLKNKFNQPIIFDNIANRKNVFECVFCRAEYVEVKNDKD